MRVVVLGASTATSNTVVVILSAKRRNSYWIEVLRVALI
jgi:hypothetical protein